MDFEWTGFVGVVWRRRIEDELPVVMFLQVARKGAVGLARFGGVCHLLGVFV